MFRVPLQGHYGHAQFWMQLLFCAAELPGTVVILSLLLLRNVLPSVWLVRYFVTTLCFRVDGPANNIPLPFPAFQMWSLTSGPHADSVDCLCVMIHLSGGQTECDIGAPPTSVATVVVAVVSVSCGLYLVHKHIALFGGGWGGGGGD